MDLPAPDVEGYKGGNTSACYQQLLQVIAANSGGGGGAENKQAPRAFAFEIASKIGAEFCQHNSAPEPLTDMSAELKKQAAARHTGLRDHAWVIAAVKTQDVETNWGSTAGNKYRNQGRLYFLLALHACYMNARSYSCSL